MKHNIRQRVLDPVRGLVTKVISVDGELGSGVLDRNGQEIFEGDIIKYTFKDVNDAYQDVKFHVEFLNGSLCADGAPLVLLDKENLEIVGHVD